MGLDSYTLILRDYLSQPSAAWQFLGVMECWSIGESKIPSSAGLKALPEHI